MADSSDIKGFFTQLRQLAADIDSSTGDLRTRIENPPKAEFSSTTVLKLQEKRKDLKKLKSEAQDKLSTVQKEGREFETVLSACNQLVDSQQKVVQNIETFLKQYGYVTFGEVTSKEKALQQEEIKKEDTCTETINNDVQEDCVKTPPGKVTRSGTGTPKLEDYGLSEYTLQALTSCHNRGARPAEMRSLSQVQEHITLSHMRHPGVDRSETGNVMEPKSGNDSDISYGTGTRMEKEHVFKTPTRVAGKPAAYGTPKLEDFGLSDYTMQSLNKFQAGANPVAPAALTNTRFQQFSSYPSSQMATPNPFQHNGIVVTPSLVSGRPIPMETPVDKRGGVAGFEVHDSPYQSPVGSSRVRGTAYMDEEPKLRLQDYFEESMSSGYGTEVYDQRTRYKYGNNPPSQTEPMSARLQNLRCAAQSLNVDGKTPPEPELLSSRLKNLRKANELSNNDGATPPEPELLSSRLNTLLATSNPASADTATPPEPELLISRLTKLRVATKQSCISEDELNDTVNSGINVAGLPKPLR